MMRFNFIQRVSIIVSIIVIILLIKPFTGYIKFYFKELTEESNYLSLPSIDQNVELGLISISSDKYMLTITNNSSLQVIVGQYYEIEKFKKNKWYKVPFKEDYAFTLEAYEIQPNNTFEQIIYMKHIDYFLKKGRYRIVKKISIDDKDVIIDNEFVVN